MIRQKHINSLPNYYYFYNNNKNNIIIFIIYGLKHLHEGIMRVYVHEFANKEREKKKKILKNCMRQSYVLYLISSSFLVNEWL